MCRGGFVKIIKDAGSIAGMSLFLLFGYLDQARGQQLPINVSPAQLTFNATVNGPATANQSIIVGSTSGAATTFTVSALSGGNWLTVSPQSGTTPQVLAVSVSTNSLMAGSYAGFVTVTSAGGTATVQVVLNVNFLGTPPFTATPNSLFFGFQTGSTTPQTQQLNVASPTGTPTALAVTSSTSNGGNWLTVSQTSATTPGSFNVTVNPTTLGTGYYFGAIAINPPNTTGLVIPVQVNVGVQTAINVNPQRLSFAYQTGTSAPSPQTIFLTTTEVPVGFTAIANTSDCIGNWMVISPRIGVAPGTISVQIDPTGLRPGACNGSIYITAPGAVNQSIQLPVSLLVSDKPVLQIPAIAPSILYQTGTTTPGAQTLQVTSSSTPLNFTVSTSTSNGGPDFLTVSPTSGTTPQTVSLSINGSVLAGLAPNAYAENVTFSSPDSAIPDQTITIPLTVTNSPILVSSAQSVTFNYQIGQSSPQNQTLTLTSTGAPLAYSISSTTTSCSGFLIATTSTGTTPVQPGQQSQVVIGVNTSGLSTPQTCSGTVMISSPGSTLAPINIPVTLNVSNTPALNLNPQTISASAVVGSPAIQSTISLASSDTATALNFSATASTNPGGSSVSSSWLSISPSAGSSPSTINVTLDPSKLTPGIYTGAISVTSTSPNVAPQSIPVVLTITGGPISASSSSLTFSQVNSGAAPASQTIQITGVPDGATVSATGTILSGANWLTVTTSGGTITVSAKGGSLPVGTYSGVVTVSVGGASNSPLYIPVILKVT
jgi:hypothetical protein